MEPLTSVDRDTLLARVRHRVAVVLDVRPAAVPGSTWGNLAFHDFRDSIS